MQITDKTEAPLCHHLEPSLMCFDNFLLGLCLFSLGDIKPAHPETPVDPISDNNQAYNFRNHINGLLCVICASISCCADTLRLCRSTHPNVRHVQHVATVFHVLLQVSVLKYMHRETRCEAVRYSAIG